MQPDRIKAFLAEMKKLRPTELRPVDRMMAALDKVESPSKLELPTPDNISDKPDGKLPTVRRRPRPRSPFPQM